MARLILKSPYLKPGGKKQPGGYLKYIATREGVEMAEDTSRHLLATAEQQKQVEKLLKKYPDSKDSYEYQDYAGNSTRGNADAFIDSVLEVHGDAPQKEFKAIRNAVVQAALTIHLPTEQLPLSDPVPPCVDFVDDGSDVYPKALESLREPECAPDPEIKQFLHEAAIRGSMDAVYGVGKQYLKTDIQKAISMFELAAEQGNAHAEYQLGKIYCFGQGVPQNLELGMDWLKASASHGNEYSSALLEKVQNHIHRQTTSAVFGLLRGSAGMIQTSANNFICRRDSIDRKQRQKIGEKKQAHGQRSDGQDYSNDMELTM